VIEAPANNGIIEYEHITDARNNFKKQVAHIFGNYLRGTAPTIKSDLKDVLSEIISLKNEWKQQGTYEKDLYLRVIRLLVEDRFKAYKDVLEFIFGSLENAVSVVAEEPTFEAVVKRAGCRLEVISGRLNMHDLHAASPDMMYKASEGIQWDIPGPPEEKGISGYALFRDRRIVVNQTALLGFQSMQKQVLQVAGRAALPPNPAVES
jgi:hypothetical protein